MGVEDDKVWHRRRRCEQSIQRSIVSLLLLRHLETSSAHASRELLTQFPDEPGYMQCQTGFMTPCNKKIEAIISIRYHSIRSRDRFLKAWKTASASYNTAKHRMLFQVSTRAEQQNRRVGGANLKTTFFTATGVTHPLSSTRSSFYRPCNNELNQDRASALSLSHSHTSWIVLQKKNAQHE